MTTDSGGMMDTPPQALGGGCFAAMGAPHDLDANGRCQRCGYCEPGRYRAPAGTSLAAAFTEEVITNAAQREFFAGLRSWGCRVEVRDFTYRLAGEYPDVTTAITLPPGFLGAAGETALVGIVDHAGRIDHVRPA